MGKKGEVKLIGSWVSPFVFRARVALNLKSIDFEFLQEKAGSKSDLLLKSNPVHKKIPVLIHHDKPICESLVIVQYIDETWTHGPSILPSDPYDRAIARFWAAYLDEKFFPALKSIRMVQGQGDEVEKKLKEIKEGLGLLDDALVKISKGKPFFGGEELGYLDIALSGFVAWIQVREKTFDVKLLHESTTPNLAVWVHNLSAHPAVKDIIPTADALIEWVRLNLGPPPPPAN
ncbi:Glutathione S-transferase U1 [Dionaea muscipula]